MEDGREVSTSERVEYMRVFVIAAWDGGGASVAELNDEDMYDPDNAFELPVEIMPESFSHGDELSIMVCVLSNEKRTEEIAEETGEESL